VEIIPAEGEPRANTGTEFRATWLHAGSRTPNTRSLSY